MKTLMERAALLATSALLAVLFALGRLLGLVFKSPRLRQFEGRCQGDPSSAWAIPVEPENGNILFFCSSAGEYEQALPIVQRLPARADNRGLALSTIFLFLSRSGLDFFRARNERGRAGLAPVDTLWNWRALQKRHKIATSVVIRHEWWPAFLQVMGKAAPLLLVDATLPAGDQESAWKNAARGYLARKFTTIFTVDAESRDFFVKKYGIEPAKVQIAGDTKFDRALDRAQAAAPAGLRNAVLEAAAGRNVLVGGSVYDQDVRLLLEAFVGEPVLREKWFLVLVPHHVGRGAGNRFVGMANAAAIPVQDSASYRPGEKCDGLVVDMMGSLAELYALASAAWIGGACHNKVHNVLEPAVHGAWLASGKRFRNSREAIMMHDAGLLRAVDSAQDVASWLKGAATGEQGLTGIKDRRTRDFIEQHAGAAQKIAGHIGGNTCLKSN